MSPPFCGVLQDPFQSAAPAANRGRSFLTGNWPLATALGVRVHSAAVRILLGIVGLDQQYLP